MYCAEQNAEQTTKQPRIEMTMPNYSVPDESKDELAIRLRTEGLTFREIGAAMGVDAAMAHRRVKRAMMRQRCEMEDRMEDIRDLEFEKLRVAERALMPQVAEGDQGAIRLLLRIIETRKRYLKDLPYKNIDEDPWAELMDDTDAGGAEEDDPFKEEKCDDESDDDEPVNESPETEKTLDEQIEMQQRTVNAMWRGLELDPSTFAAGTARGELAREIIEVEQQKLLALQRAASTKGSTDSSTTPSTRGSTRPSRTPSKDSTPSAKAQRKKRGRKVKRAA